MSNGSGWWQTITQSVVAGALLGILAAIWKFVSIVIGLEQWRKRHEQNHPGRKNDG